MAKFCPNCGNPIEVGAIFCRNCGAKLPAQTDVRPEQAPARNYGDSFTQPPQQPRRQYAQYQQPVQQPNQPYAQYGAQQYGAPQPPKKKRTGLIIVLSIVGVISIAVLIGVIILISALLKPHKDNPLPTEHKEVTEQVVEAATDAPAEEPTEGSADPGTEAPAEAPTDPPAELPYVNDLGKIDWTDFAWISDAMSGGLQGNFLSNDELLGKWKGEFLFGGIWELVYITIDADGTVTVQPNQINYGDGWEDESGDASYTFQGAFDINRVYGSGQYGNIDLYQFLSSGGSEYAVGELKTISGYKAEVYLVRP